MIRLITFMSFMTVISQGKCLQKQDTTKFPIPYLNIFDGKDSVTAEVIKKMDLWPDKVVLFGVFSEIPERLSDAIKGVYVSVDSLELIFAKDYTVPLHRTRELGGPVAVLAIHWPDRFKLINGSRILLRFWYTYRRKNDVLTS